MNQQAPLAEKLRPHKLSDFVGQSEIVGKNKIINKLLAAYKNNKFFPSLVLWGPPGCGKTTLARIIAGEIKKPFYEFSAVNTSVKEIQKTIESHKNSDSPTLFSNQEERPTAPIIFLDEIHRFNKAQQDALLPHVEDGSFILIGATTENPSFEVIAPLLSRCRVIVLKQHSEEEIQKIAKNAAKQLNVEITTDGLDFIGFAANGDARSALNIIEISANIADSKKLDKEIIKKGMQKEQLTFDRQGEEFYNTISAFHKSIRGSDPDAALYYLARMLEAGQDPLYVARRMIRMASEDIGLKNTNALNICVSAFLACERIGMPECKLALAEAAVYLAKSPKSNKLYLAYGKAAEDVKKYGNLPIPLHIRNAPTKLMKELGYGKNYDYSHSNEGKKKENIDYLSSKIKNRKYL